MKAYKTIKMPRTGLKGVKTFEADTLEIQIERMLNNEEKLKETVPLLYFERKEGVIKTTNPRYDRWEDMATAGTEAKRTADEKMQAKEVKLKAEKGGASDGQAESIQGKQQQ